MSVQAMSWALTQNVATHPTSRHILLCLANYADQDGRAAFPSVATLARDTGLAERTIRTRLDDLEKCGAIVRGNQAIVRAYIERGDRRPVCYDLPISRGAAPAGRKERGASDTGTGCSSRTNGVHLTQERGAGAAPNPSVKPSSNPSLKPLLDDSKESPAKQVKKRRALPEDFKPSDQHIALAGELKIDLRFEFPQFVDYHKAKRSTMADWDAALRTWIRNAAKFAKGKNSPPSGRPGYFKGDDYSNKNYHEGIDKDGRF